MFEWLSIYRAGFSVCIAQQLQYRASLAIWLTGMILQPVMALAVWSAVAASKGGTVGAFSPPEFAAYFIVAMMVQHATFDWHMWENDYRIRHGRFSVLLLKPINPIHIDLADNITYKTLTLTVMLPTAVILGFLFHARIEPRIWSLCLFFPALLLAFALRFIISYALSLIPFWTTRATAIYQAFFVVGWFLSGQVSPLSLLPDKLRMLAYATPFPWTISFPVELFLGRMSLERALYGLGAQALWLAVSLGVFALVWKRGVKRYSAVGA